MKDVRFLRMTIFLSVFVLLSPLFYHFFYEHTRMDRVIDEINSDFKIAYFYPDSMLAYTEGRGKDKIFVLDYEHINQDGIKRLENQSKQEEPCNLKIDEYLARFEGEKGFDEINNWIDEFEKAQTEYLTVERNGRQMILAFNNTEKKAVFFNCKI